MELEKQAQRYWKPSCRRTVVQEETAEAIVPDTSPDVERIVSVSGVPILRGKECRQGSVTVSGGVKAAVLYVPEGENLPRTLELYLPFVTKLEDPAVELEDQIFYEGFLRGLDARMINSRKILVRANLAVCVTAWAPTEEEICVSASGVEGLQIKTAVLPMTLPVAAAEKSFTLTDSAELPAGTASGLCDWTAGVEVTESRVVGNRGVFKGNVNVQVLYRTEGDELENWSFSAPFSQFAELENAQEGDELQVTAVLTGADLDFEQGNRWLYSFSLAAQCLALSRREVTLIEDLYSVRYPLTLQRQSLQMENRLDRQQQYQNLRQTIPSDASEVLGAQVYLELPDQQREGDELTVGTSALVNLLYRDPAGALQGVSGRVQVQTRLPLAQGCTCQAVARLARDIFAAPAAEGMEVRFGVVFDICCYASGPLEGVCGAEIGEEAGEEGEQPSVIVRTVEDEQSLWEIAKACRTTVEAICQANGLQSPEAPAGRLLLIPRAG